MKKKTYEKIPSKLLKISKLTDVQKTANYLYRSKLMDDGVLMITFYNRKNVIPYSRIFMNKPRHQCMMLEIANNHWEERDTYNSNFHHLITRKALAPVYKADLDRIKKYAGCNSEADDIAPCINHFIYECSSFKRLERKRKEYERVQKDLEVFKEPNKAFKDWVFKTVFSGIDNPRKKQDKQKVTLLERLDENQLALRYFDCQCYYGGNDAGERIITWYRIDEHVRMTLNNEFQVKAKYDNFGNSGMMNWCGDEYDDPGVWKERWYGSVNCKNTRLYPGNIDKLLAVDPAFKDFKYSQIDFLAKNYLPVDPLTYLCSYREYPQFEYLVKGGLNRIAYDLADRWMYANTCRKLKEVKAIHEALGLTKSELKTIASQNERHQSILGVEGNEWF
jgi:hypothetical protein